MARKHLLSIVLPFDPFKYWFLIITIAAVSLLLFYAQPFQRLGDASKSILADWPIVSVVGGCEVSRRDKSVKICLNRPDKGNSLDTATIKNITHLFRRFSADDSVRRIILTGRGRFFCTGMDLHENLKYLPAQRYSALQELFQAIETCPHTTIAAINGSAFGGGVGLSFACDIRIAIEASSFCLSEVTLGLCPAAISKILVREWGTSLTRMAMLTGSQIQSLHLHNTGAIHYLAKDLLELSIISEGLLKRLQSTAPQASAWNKTLVREIANVGTSVDSLCGKIFKSMLAEDSESAYGVKQFQDGIRAICWDKISVKKSNLSD